MTRLTLSFSKTLITSLALLTLGNLKAWSADQTPLADAAWGPVTEGVQMWARPRKAVYNADEVMFLDVSVRYTSPKVHAFVEESDPQSEFDVIVKDSKGRAVPDKNGGAHDAYFFNQMIMHTRRIGLNLRPDQTATFHFWLNSLYKITLPGPYFVIVKRFAPKLEGSGLAKVISNTAVVTVIKANKSLVWPRTDFNDPENHLGNPFYSLPPGVAEPDKK